MDTTMHYCSNNKLAIEMIPMTNSSTKEGISESILSSIIRYSGIAISYKNFDRKYSDLLEDGYYYDDKIIPPFLFRSSPFTLKTLPIQFKTVLNQTLNDNAHDFVQIYFDDDDAELFVNTYFPQHLLGYKSLIPGAYKVDILRLLLLLKYGGIYNDIGHMYLKPIRSVVRKGDEFISVCTPDLHIYNAFMAAYRNHPLIKAFIEHIMSKVNRKEYSNNALNITGPFALSDAFRAFTNTSVSFNKVEISGFRFKFLSFNHNLSCIHDIDGSQFIRTKLPLRIHLKILYSDVKHIHYGKLWEDRKVYHHPHHSDHYLIIYLVLLVAVVVVLVFLLLIRHKVMKVKY